MDQSSGEQCWPTATHKMMQQDWHGRSQWEWGDLYASSASQADRFERLPMAEWAGSDQDLSFNNHHHLHLGKELHFKTISAADPDTAAVMVAAAAAAGSGLGEVMGLGLMEDGKGVKIFDCLKNTSDDNSRAAAAAISSGWLVEAQSMSNGSSCVVGGGGAAANSAKNGFLMVGLGPESDTSNGNGGCGVFHHGGGQLGNDVQGDSLTCLKLGKRQYYENNANAAAAAAANSVNQSKPPVSMVSVSASPPPQISSSTCSIGTNAVSSSYKKPRASPSSASQPPRCQVEGCSLVLTSAKDYHRRHKVCEVHAKSPKVIVNSIEQRFCQQCSRFHVISEFDDAKRSCRRRLAGHNERRRKNASDALNISSVQEEKRLMNAMGERLRLGSFSLPCLSSARRALSLLSSSQKPSWMLDTGISGDLSYRSSMALNELIAQNRAAAATATQSHSQSLRFSEDPQQQLFTHIRPHQQSSGNVSRALFMFQNASNSHNNNSFQEQNHHHHHHHQQQQELQETMESCRFMPSLRSLEMREHDYGLIDSNVVVRPTLDLMQHNSIFALRSNPTSSTSSSDEKCSFWKSLEGTGIA